MKTKIGTILEDEVVQKLKGFSVRERRPMSDIIEEAIVTYMQTGNSRKQDFRLAALKRLCVRPFILSNNAWKELSEEDYYEQ
jgi:hypothetical protein